MALMFPNNFAFTSFTSIWYLTFSPLSILLLASLDYVIHVRIETVSSAPLYHYVEAQKMLTDYTNEGTICTLDPKVAPIWDKQHNR